MRRLLTYTTFFITRHPFERLVSAFFDKFAGDVRELARVGKRIAVAQADIYIPRLHFKKNGYIQRQKLLRSFMPRLHIRFDNQPPNEKLV